MATEINPFGDVKKMIEQFKMPGVDMTAIVDARRACQAAVAAFMLQALEGVSRASVNQSTRPLAPRAPRKER